MGWVFRTFERIVNRTAALPSKPLPRGFEALEEINIYTKIYETSPHILSKEEYG